MPRAHKRKQRLFVSQPLTEGKVISLSKAQANNLTNVLHKKTGDQVVLFNGVDGAWLATICALSHQAVQVECVSCFAPHPPPNDLWYGFAPLKLARLDYMVQKATEMGVSIIQPVITSNTQIKHIKLDRIKANVIAAGEQCEVLNLPRIIAEISLPELIENWPVAHKGRVLILADEGMKAASPIEQLLPYKNQPLGLLIGPEGGFSRNERDLLKRCDFVERISLGPRILRADTAAIAALALIQATIGDWPKNKSLSESKSLSS